MKLVLHVQHIVDANKIYCEDYTLGILNSLYSVAPCVPHIFALVCRGGLVELLKGHKRNCPYANCSCPKCASHEHLLALRNEDKGKRWRTNLTQSCTAKKAEDHQAIRFPEMTAQLDSEPMFALKVANFEAAKKAMEKSKPKSEQWKGKHVYND